MNDIQNYSLKHNNTFGIDVKCRRFIEFDTLEELLDVLEKIKKDDKILVIGGGSNFLFTKDFSGIVLRSNIKGINVKIDDHDVFLCSGSGEVWDDVVNYSTIHGYYGMENLSLIPGDVGASAVQNIGAYGAEASDIIYEIEALDVSKKELVKIKAIDCGYSYRGSKFKTEWLSRFIITHVTYRLSKDFHPRLDYGGIREELLKRGISSPSAKQLRDAIISIRKEKLPDPKVHGNAGSFFMNPIVEEKKYQEIKETFGEFPSFRIDSEHVKIPAGWMIEKCGWKGKVVGHVGVHPRQALVLVNLGGAVGSEIKELSIEIQRDVKETFGVEISPEVNIL
ncbi:MAG: UDP-N-acetylmuramate dehydrogenase [Prevotella sp.]|nr:UDP-N-acetylmuramate dehydrogenase [Prevotella sp.]